MSSFNGQDLFGSGPHEFSQGPQGFLVVQNGTPGSPAPGSSVLGKLELDVFVEGRLVADDSAGLWDLRDAITSLLGASPTVATLVGEDGREWTSMAFIHFEEDGPVDRGRVHSIAYRAVFREFLASPSES